MYLLILDDLHVDPDLGAYFIEQATLFIERYVGNNDLMGIIYTSGRRLSGRLDFEHNGNALEH